VKIGVPWAYHVVDSLRIPVADGHREWLEKEFVARNLVLPYQEALAANSEKGIMASIDASDGIGGALHLMCHMSNVGIQVNYRNMCEVVHETAVTLAASLDVDPVSFAFSPGFTWENVFAIDPEAMAAVSARVAGAGGRLITLGHFVMEPGSRIEMGGRRVRSLALYFNEGFRDERYLSNSVEAWRAHRFIVE
jgi:thiamine monophosphate kinase